MKRYPETATAGRGAELVLYPGPRILVTTGRVRSAAGQFRVADLDRIECEYGRRPPRTVALICAAVEVLLVLPPALAYGAVGLFLAGLLVAAVLAAAIIAEGRRHPRRMALRAWHRGRPVLLFTSVDRQEFEQVRRAVIRAVEANRLF